MEEAMKETCGTFHDLPALSIFGATTFVIIGILTTLVNLPICFCIAKAVQQHERKFRHFFYKLLIFITFSDLLKALLVTPFGVSFCIREVLQKDDIEDYELFILHLALLIPDAVALVTTSCLSFDRILLLWFPKKYIFGFAKNKEKMILLCIWPIAVAMTIPYFFVNFIKQLLVYSGITIVAALTSLVLLVVSSNKKLVKRKGSEYQIQAVTYNKSTFPLHTIIPKDRVCSVRDCSIMEDRNMSPKDATKLSQKPAHSNFWENLLNRRTSQQPTLEKRINSTFLKLLLTFLGTYFPLICFTLYLNLVNGSCTVTHVLRGMTSTFIFASSLLRGLNFFFTLKHVREVVLKTFCCRKVSL